MNNYSNELLQIQEKLDKGEIRAEELDESVIDQLILLYKEQIGEVKESITNNKKKIIEIKKKMRVLNPHFKFDNCMKNIYNKHYSNFRGFSMEEKWMDEALKEAQKAYDKLEIPVGAIIVKDNKIISRAHNLKETKKTAIAHAEILAIQKANKKLDNWRLLDCDMYVTLEPCEMCMGAITSSRIKNIYIGTLDPKKNDQIDIDEYKQRYGIDIHIGIRQDKCEYILKEFFKNLRKA